MKTVTLSILGNCSIEVGDLKVKPDSPLLFFLLLYLCVEEGRSIPRSELLELLFPAAHDRQAASHSLRQLLYRLRRLGVPLLFQAGHVSTPLGTVKGSLHELASESLEARSAHLDRGVVVLPHYAPPNASASEWTERLKDRWHSFIRRLLNDDLQAFRQRADWRAIETVARRLLELDPLNESATLYLAEAIARTGSKTLALSFLSKYESDVGQTEPHLTLPSRVLRRRIIGIDEATRDGRKRQLPLLGRAKEIGELTLAWNSSLKGCFRVLCLTGDRNVGKTRLLQELSALVSVDGSGVVIWSRLSEREHGRPLALFADLARQLVGLPGAAGCDPSALSLLRFLAEAKSPSGPIGSAFAHSRYDEAGIRNALSELIGSVGEEQPILCLIDGSEELDRSSVAMLSAVKHRQPQTRALFVVAERARPGGSVLVTQGIATQLHIAPLSQESSRELLQAMTEEHAAARPGAKDVDWVLDVAAGHPGHLELLLRSTAHAQPNRRIPADIIALVDEQLSALSIEAQHALQALAISGDAITPSVLGCITGLADYALVSALSEVDGASLVRQEGGALMCRSALIAERSLNSASPVVLSLMHERAAKVLEAEHIKYHKSATLAWRISGHWKAAGQSQRARDFLRACWQQAIDVGQPMVACEAIHKELAACCDPHDRALLLDDLIGALQSAGELGLLNSAITERRALAARVGDGPGRLASLAFDQTEVDTLTYWSPAKYRESLLEQLSTPYLDSQRRLRAARLLMMAADEALDMDLASHAHSVGQSIRPEDELSDLLRRHVALFFHSVFGDRDRALAIAADIEKRVELHGRSWLKYVSRRNCFLALQLVGTGTTDYSHLERDFLDCLDAGMISNALQSAALLASILIDDGDITKADDWLQRSTLLVEANHVTTYPLDFLSGQVDVALLVGDEPRARNYLRKMHESAQRYEFGRLRDDLLLYQLRVDQICGSSRVSSAQLAELLRYHEIGRRFGRHDDHMDVLWVALGSVGRTEEASKLLLAYLTTHRRERRPCRYFLKSRTASDPAWELLRTHALSAS